MVILNDPGSPGKRNLNYAFPPFAMGLPSVFERAGFDVNRSSRSRSGSRSSSRAASLNSSASSMRTSSYGSHQSLSTLSKPPFAQPDSRSNSMTSAKFNFSSPKHRSYVQGSKSFDAQLSQKNAKSSPNLLIPTPTISVEDLTVKQGPDAQTEKRNSRASGHGFKFPMPQGEDTEANDSYNEVPLPMPTPDPQPSYDGPSGRLQDPAVIPEREEEAYGDLEARGLPDQRAPDFDNPSAHYRNASFKFDDDFDNEGAEKEESGSPEPEIRPRYINEAEPERDEEGPTNNSEHSEFAGTTNGGHAYKDILYDGNQDSKEFYTASPPAESYHGPSGSFEQHEGRDINALHQPQESQGSQQMQETNADFRADGSMPEDAPVAPPHHHQPPMRFQGIPLQEEEDSHLHSGQGEAGFSKDALETLPGQDQHERAVEQPAASHEYPQEPASAGAEQGFPMPNESSQSIPRPGAPMSGTPPNGMPMDGMPPNGMPMNGMPPNGMPMNGMPPNGRPMNGMPMNGMPMNGMPMNGMPMNRIPMNGMPMNGMPMSGSPMSGSPMGGMRPQGAMPGPQPFYGQPPMNQMRPGHPNVPMPQGPEYRPKGGPVKSPDMGNPDLFMTARPRFPKQSSKSPTIGQGEFSPASSPNGFNNSPMQMRPNNPQARRMPPPGAFPRGLPPNMGPMPGAMPPPPGFNGRPPMPPQMMGPYGPPHMRPMGPMSPQMGQPPMGQPQMGQPQMMRGPQGQPMMRPAGPMPPMGMMPPNMSPAPSMGNINGPEHAEEFESENQTNGEGNEAEDPAREGSVNNSLEGGAQSGTNAAETAPLDVTLPSPISIAKQSAPNGSAGLLSVHDRHLSSTSSIYSARNTEAPSFYGSVLGAANSQSGDRRPATNRTNAVSDADITAPPHDDSQLAGHSSEPSQTSSLSFSFDQAPLSTSPPARADTWYSAKEDQSIRERTPAEASTANSVEVMDGQTPTLSQGEFPSDTAVPQKAAKSGRKQCRGCTLPITGKSVRALDGTLSGRWHRECFNCTRCNVSLAGVDKIHVLEDQPYCSRCYHMVNHSTCQKCGEGIEGSCLETRLSSDGGEPFLYHPSCLRCDQCHIKLQHSYFDVGGSTYCAEHAFTSLPADTSVHKRYTQFMMI